MKRRHVPSLISTALLFCLPSLAAAQLIQAVGSAPAKAPAEEKVPTSSLVLQSADEPREALKYRLLPPLVDRTPGNAAIQYQKLALLVSDRVKKLQQVADWLDLPMDKLPREEVRQTLDSFKSVLDDLDAAARRDHCDWELLFREGNFFGVPLPELQPMQASGGWRRSRRGSRSPIGNSTMRSIRCKRAMPWHVTSVRARLLFMGWWASPSGSRCRHRSRS